MRYLVTILCLLQFAAGAAVAECLWDEKPELDRRFQAFVTKAAPRLCRRATYGYSSLFSPNAGVLKYEMNVITNGLCFRAIGSRLRALQGNGALIACRSNAAREVAMFPNSGGGKAIIFTFKASAAEVREASRYGQ